MYFNLNSLVCRSETPKRSQSGQWKTCLWFLLVSMFCKRISILFWSSVGALFGNKGVAYTLKGHKKGKKLKTGGQQEEKLLKYH